MIKIIININIIFNIYCNFDYYNYSHLTIVLYFIFVFHKLESKEEKSALDVEIF